MLYTYYEELMETNKKFNLTAIEGAEDAARLHFVDSLALFRFADIKGKRLIDIGTGAGFPGMPLLISDPTMDVTLLDSSEKKIGFLTQLGDTLGLNPNCIAGRAEEVSRKEDMRESFDYAVSRAVARLNVLTELSLPFVKVGGCFLSMKSADTDEEIAEAKNAIELLGGIISDVQEYTLPETDIPRRVVIIKKVSPTPEKYPRRFARIQKSPL
jgi:16S rRNA (guanine527-N7)-methyltransferase